MLIFGVPWKVILLELLWSVAFGGFIGCCYHLILRDEKVSPLVTLTLLFESVLLALMWRRESRLARCTHNEMAQDPTGRILCLKCGWRNFEPKHK